MKTLKNFKPMDGCNEKCPIALKERNKKSEICCDGGARQCCFFCMEIECPIKYEYQEIIKQYDGILDVEDI